MTRARAQELRDVFNAFCEGREIQRRFSAIHEWETIPEPEWFPDFEYRVKPEPRTIWVTIDPAENMVAHDTEAMADVFRRHYSAASSLRIMKFIEVIE